MLIDVAKMAKNTHILFSQFFARFANGYMAYHNGNPLGVTSVISLLMFATCSYFFCVWSEPSVRRISTSVSVGVGMCSVVASDERLVVMQLDIISITGRLRVSTLRESMQ